MKKLPFILIALCLLTTQLRAQVVAATARELSLISRGVRKSVQKGNPLYIPGKSTVGRTGLYSFQVTRVLERRAAKARSIARTVQKEISTGKYTGVLQPVDKLKNPTVNITPLLESTPYAHNNKHASLYLVARENRLYTQQMRHLQREVWQRFKRNLPALRRAARAPEPPDPMSFIARVIPSQVNTIGIGEMHGFKNTNLFLEQLLPLIRKARPDQEIFLFTEFLSRMEEYPSFGLHSSIYTSILGHEATWRVARQNNIHIIGLEPREVLREATLTSKSKRKAFFTLDGSNGRKARSFFASATGIKWRNESFAKTLQKYRQQHPDALFILYMGDGHVNYTGHFAVTAKLEPQKTFVISIRPTKQQTKKRYANTPAHETRFMWDPLGNITNGKESFDKPLLYLEDPRLARIAGANIYVQVEDRFLRNAVNEENTPR